MHKPKSLFLLYVLLGYVIVQFLWWAFLLYELNINLMKAQLVPDVKALNGKLIMIVGEGTVFLTLLLVGAYFIRKFLLKEHRMAIQESNFLLATTHELNSPLAALLLNLQTLKNRALSDLQKSTMIDSAIDNTGRLRNLVSNILMVSRLDGQKMDLLPDRQNVKRLINETVSLYKTSIEQQGGHVEVECVDNLEALLDKSAFQLIVSNVMENAVKYAPRSDVSIRCRVTKSDLHIAISDTGPGVKEGDLNLVLKKFHRIESEQTRSQKGTGLGLYLVKQLVELHGGNVTVSLNKPHGLIISMLFRNIL